MAYLEHKHCPACDCTRAFINDKCPVCHAKAEKKRIAAWNRKSTKAKLDDLRRRVEALEAGPARYC